jgi:hypothetical protein
MFFGPIYLYVFLVTSKVVAIMFFGPIYLYVFLVTSKVVAIMFICMCS